MRRSITRAAAGAAVAAATMLALAGPASAAAASPRLHTTLSIVQSRTHIRPGQADVIGGRLAHDGIGLPGRVVFLDRVYGTTLVEVQVHSTGPAGGVAFTVRPGVTARYELIYKGNAVYAPTHSGIVTVRVIFPPPPRVRTALSIVQSRTHIRPGQADEISGRLAARGVLLAGRTVYLDRVSGGTLVVVQVGTTGPAGGVAFTVRPGVTSRYQLVYKGSARYYPTHSGIVTVWVSP